MGESTQTIDTAGGPTSSDPALRPAHLTLAGSLGPSAPLKRSLWSLGKAFRRTSRLFLFPVPYSLFPGTKSPINQNFPNPFSSHIAFLSSVPRLIFPFRAAFQTRCTHRGPPGVIQLVPALAMLAASTVR